MTALITPVSDAAAALRVNHEKTETALVQVKYYYYDKLKNPDWFYLSGTGLPRLSWKRGR